jgi:hypothetical protein
MSGLLSTWLGGGGGPGLLHPGPPPASGTDGSDSQPPHDEKEKGKARYETGFDPTALERGMLLAQPQGCRYSVIVVAVLPARRYF